MRTNISDESRNQTTGKPRHTGNFGRRDLPPDEIIRLVKERYRICDILFALGGFWIAIGGICMFFATRENSLFDTVMAWVLMLIGIAVFSTAFALTLAVYRCPVCDKHLSPFRSDKLRCPGCGAQVKESA